MDKLFTECLEYDTMDSQGEEMEKCTKIGYKGMGMAKKSLPYCKERADENMHVYFCKACKKYHIGHDETM